MAGNKIQNLQLLRDAGFNVPGFVVIPFSAAVDKDKYKKLLAGKKVTGTGEFDGIIEACLREDFDIGKFLDPGSEISLFSVRSSCNIEDGSELSFEGTFDS